jgi:hypothetical protein
MIYQSNKWVGFFLLVMNQSMVHVAFSQDALNELTVDRPGIAETPFTVAPRTFQFEVGFDYFKRYNGQLYNLPSALLRTGINRRMELRVASRQTWDKTDGNSFKGVSPISAGIKMHIVKQNGRLPETDILTNVVVPINPTASQSKNVGYELLLLFQNDFYPNTAINYNVGYIWDSNRGKSIFTASFCFNYLPTSRVGLFAEYFGYFPGELPDEHGLDGGITYLLRPKLQLDLSAGVSRLDEENNLFVSSGFTVRIN